VPLTKENHAMVPELIEYLRSIGIAEGGIIHIRFFLSPKNRNGVCVSHSPLCDEGEAHALLLKKIWETAWSRGFRATAKPTQTPYCTGTKEGSYIVGPKGYVYKCLTQVGTSEKAGVIKNGVINTQSNIFYDLMKRDVTAITECTSCKYAPICAGGCPVRSKEKYNTYHAPDCGPRKELFDKRIQLFLRFKYPQHFGEDEGTRTPNV
jgi:radical SAM protein with 4Fe4S-binding SPASM domain